MIIITTESVTAVSSNP